MGFPSKLFFQDSSIFSNKSHTYKELLTEVLPHPVIKLTDLQFNVSTDLKLSDEIFFNTTKTPIKRAFYWNQKILKIMTPKGFSTQNRGWKVHVFL